MDRTPEEDLLGKELAEHLGRGVAGLSAADRLLLEDAADGVPAVETAKQLSTTVSALKSRLFRVRRAIGERLAAGLGPLTIAVGIATVALPSSAQAAPPIPPKPAPVLVAPKLVSDAEVIYPAGAKGDASVVLALVIGKDGHVTSAKVEDGEEPFASAASAAALGWTFEPATRDGVPIVATIRFKVTFTEPPPPAPQKDPEPSPDKPTTEGVPSPKTKPKKASVDTITELEVEGDKLPPAATSFSRAEVRELPGAFGDPFRAVEAMPGATPIVSGVPFFYVRGAPPGNVGYYLDGVRVPYLYHVGLGPSVVHPGIVDHVDLHPGGYPARFGRYAGGIVTGETTEPRATLHGEASIRLFDVGALAETGFADGRGTALVSFRYSYTAAILSLVAKDYKLDYRDFQVRLGWDLTPKDRLTAFAFGAYDLLGRVQNDTLAVLFGSEFYRVDLRWDHRGDDGTRLRVATTLGWDRSRMDEQRNATDRLIGTRIELRHPLAKKVLLRAGADFTSDGYGAGAPKYVDRDDPATQRATALFPPRTDFAGGVWADIVADVAGVQVTPGVRVDFFRSGATMVPAVDPRLALKFPVSKSFRIIQTYGLAHQPPSFAVPVPGLSPGTLADGLQTSVQAAAGVELDLPADFTATATVFHNAFFAMTDNIGTDNANADAGPLDNQRAAGRSYGLEVFVRRRLSRKVGGFLSYTLSRSERTLNGHTSPASFDRTHVANAALAWDLGRNFRAGARLVYTGAPSLVRSRGLVTPPSPDTRPSRRSTDSTSGSEALVALRNERGSPSWSRCSTHAEQGGRGRQRSVPSASRTSGQGAL
ncbi:MAG: energy transducer TonB [Myxococcales bacterium]|nr:energy transducer TonB [Myxococcales bacterium]